MAVTAVGFDGTVSEAQWANYQMRANEIAYRHGVWNGGAVTVGTGTRGVSVAVVDAIVPGVWLVSDGPTNINLTANANPSSSRRMDYIVAEVNWSTNAVTLKAVAGTPTAGLASPPALTQNPGVLWQIPLARAVVRGGATVVEADDIEVCKPLPRKVGVNDKDVQVKQIKGDVTVWKTISDVVVTDPGWPYRLQIMAEVRFDQMPGGAARLRSSILDTGVVLATTFSPDLDGKASALLNTVSAVQTGTVHVLLEMLASGVGNAATLQVLDSPANQFTVTRIPA